MHKNNQDNLVHNIITNNVMTNNVKYKNYDNLDHNICNKINFEL